MHHDELQQGLIDVRKYFETHGQKNYRGTISLIVGLPGDTEQHMIQTQQWLLQHWQGQSFYVNPLIIPTGDWHKSSKLSFNYIKMGYRQIPTRLEDIYLDFVRRNPENYVMWENDNMNFYQAEHIVKNFTKLKDDNDFRLTVHSLGEKFKGYTDLQDLLIIKSTGSLKLHDHDLTSYVNSKLSNLSNT